VDVLSNWPASIIRFLFVRVFCSLGDPGLSLSLQVLNGLLIIVNSLLGFVESDFVPLVKQVVGVGGEVGRELEVLILVDILDVEPASAQLVLHLLFIVVGVEVTMQLPQVIHLLLRFLLYVREYFLVQLRYNLVLVHQMLKLALIAVSLVRLGGRAFFSDLVCHLLVDLLSLELGHPAHGEG